MICPDLHYKTVNSFPAQVSQLSVTRHSSYRRFKVYCRFVWMTAAIPVSEAAGEQTSWKCCRSKVLRVKKAPTSNLVFFLRKCHLKGSWQKLRWANSQISVRWRKGSTECQMIVIVVTNVLRFHLKRVCKQGFSFTLWLPTMLKIHLTLKILITWLSGNFLST